MHSKLVVVLVSRYDPSKFQYPLWKRTFGEHATLGQILERWALDHGFDTGVVSDMTILSALSSSMRLVDAILGLEVREGGYFLRVDWVMPVAKDTSAVVSSLPSSAPVSKRPKLNQVRMSSRYCKVAKETSNHWKENSERKLTRRNLDRDLCPQGPLLEALREQPVGDVEEIPFRQIELHCRCPVGSPSQSPLEVVVCGPKPLVDRFVSAGACVPSKRFSWHELCPVVIPTKGRSEQGGFCMEAEHVGLGNSNVLLLAEPHEYEDYASIWHERLFMILPASNKARRDLLFLYLPTKHYPWF